MGWTPEGWMATSFYSGLRQLTIGPGGDRPGRFGWIDRYRARGFWLIVAIGNPAPRQTPAQIVVVMVLIVVVIVGGHDGCIAPIPIQNTGERAPLSTIEVEVVVLVVYCTIIVPTNLYLMTQKF